MLLTNALSLEDIEAYFVIGVVRRSGREDQLSIGVEGSASRSTPRAARHWSRSIRRARRCASGNVTSRWRAAWMRISPATMIKFSRAHMLAPDGRCKTFDAGADGYGAQKAAQSSS